jgi:arsenate reductase
VRTRSVVLQATAFFDQLADPKKARALSAGTQPRTSVHPEVATVMREIGVDLSAAAPRLLTLGRPAVHRG